MTLGIDFLKQCTIITLTADDNVLNYFSAAAFTSKFQLLGKGNSSIKLFTMIKIMVANRAEIIVMMTAMTTMTKMHCLATKIIMMIALIHCQQ